MRVIREWLDDADHTQEALAKLIGERLGREFSQSSISLIGRGHQQPRADVVGAFRAVLGIEPEWWIPDMLPSSDGCDPQKTESGEMPAATIANTADDAA